MLKASRYDCFLNLFELILNEERKWVKSIKTYIVLPMSCLEACSHVNNKLFSSNPQRISPPETSHVYGEKISTEKYR